MIKILERARPDILSLQPYQHAAWEPSLERMHANEMPWAADGDSPTAGLNRYPEPQPLELIEHLAELYQVAPECVLAGRGSDEGIDLLTRAFCRAEHDSILISPPTFGMYKVSARIQGAGVVEVPLIKSEGFRFDTQAVLDAWNPRIKLVYVCSPNNPTGNPVERKTIETLCQTLTDQALVVVDEAYIEFAKDESASALLGTYENLVVLRTLSKAYALAGTRCGAVLAHPQIIELLARVITPYSLPSTTIRSVLEFTDHNHREQAQAKIATILREREALAEALKRSTLVRHVWPSDANFLLVECTDAEAVLRAANAAGLIIRDTRSQLGLSNCLRISIGTPEQNERLARGIAQARGAVA